MSILNRCPECGKVRGMKSKTYVYGKHVIRYEQCESCQHIKYDWECRCYHCKSLFPHIESKRTYYGKNGEITISVWVCKDCGVLLKREGDELRICEFCDRGYTDAEPDSEPSFSGQSRTEYRSWLCPYCDEDNIECRDIQATYLGVMLNPDNDSWRVQVGGWRHASAGESHNLIEASLKHHYQARNILARLSAAQLKDEIEKSHEAIPMLRIGQPANIAPPPYFAYPDYSRFSSNVAGILDLLAYMKWRGPAIYTVCAPGNEHRYGRCTIAPDQTSQACFWIRSFLKDPYNTSFPPLSPSNFDSYYCDGWLIALRKTLTKYGAYWVPGGASYAVKLF